MKVQILVPLLIYLSLLFSLGLYFSHKTSSGMHGFFLGEKKLNRFAISISSVISARGAWLLLGVSAQAYIMGLSAIWLVAGFIISEFILFLFLAPLLRKYSGINGCLTLTDIVTSRFQDQSKTLGILFSSALLFFSFIFISTQFMSGGRALFAFLGLSNSNGIIITGVIVLFYVLLGGAKTINYADVFHVFLILFVLICLPIVILIRREGFENIQSEILMTMPDFFNFRMISSGVLIGFLSIGLGSAGNPNLLIKYMSVSEPKHFKSMLFIQSSTNIILAAAAILTGILARVYFPGSESIPGAEVQNVFIGIAGMIFPPVVIGLVLISILATVMSAAGSQLLVSSSSIVNDIFEKTLNNGTKTSVATLIFYSRIAIVVIVYGAILGGIFIDTDIFRLMLFSAAGLGASIGPAIIFTLFWKNVTMAGIKAGIITGSLTVIIWKSSPFLSELLYEFTPGFLTACFSVWIVSKIDKKITSMKFNRKAHYDEIKKSGLVK